ncbi:DUF3237 domain-containing protein [Novosphingobium flavum]|uniref:UPF0311 protein H7F51_05410 n=2 Tax=Novosphingobium flavum TaxID=1778672 RepID=A0A7X1KKX7_9SPHN|nr:DUF3237 domain-containing protein [Novosphingobium flavum]
MLAGLGAGAEAQAPQGQSAPTPKLTYAFSVRVEVAAPVEQGTIDGGRRRFIAITGGTVYGPRLKGKVLPGGGDWQTIMEGGLTRVLARYFLKSESGAVIEITNPGLRVASPEVTEQLARGEAVDPSAYYFRTTPEFRVSDKGLDWLQRSVFVARGIRRPDHVVVDYFIVE